MPKNMLTPEQIKKIEQIENPLVKQRYIKFYQLPKDLQETIFSEDTANKIWNIGKEQNKFSDEQLRSLAYLTGLVLLGETPLGEFSKKLQEKCDLDELTAKKIIQEIAREIFAPVKESLKKIHASPSDLSAKSASSAESAESADFAEKEGLTPELESAPSSPSGSADLAEKESKPEIPTIRPTYREPIEPSSVPLRGTTEGRPSFVKTTEGKREIPVPPSNIIDLKNL